MHFVGVGYEGQPWLELLSERYAGYLHKGDLSAGLKEDGSLGTLQERATVANAALGTTAAEGGAVRGLPSRGVGGVAALRARPAPAAAAPPRAAAGRQRKGHVVRGRARRDLARLPHARGQGAKPLAAAQPAHWHRRPRGTLRRRRRVAID